MIYRFADCELDEHLYQLRRNGVPVALEPKVFDVLAYLIEHHDRVVSKDELLDKLWPGQVVGENALTRCIRAARAAVGDDGTKQAIIETQHGRGYRFIGAVVSREEPLANEQEVSTVMPAQAGIQGPQAQASDDSSWIPTLRQSSGQAFAGMPSPSVAPQTDSPSLQPKQTQDNALPTRSWLSKNSVLTAVFLLTVIVFTVQYVSRPTLSTQSSALSPPTQPLLPLPDKPSIAVLPFTNMSKDPEQEYFSDGITEDITSDLSRIASLFVIARNSAFTYKGKAVKVQDVSREMGVRYVLEGSVRKSDNQVRITAQLIDATTGEHLWSECYDRPLKDIFALQDEIRQKIVLALKVKLTPEEQERFRRAPTNNLEAYDFHLRGLESWLRAYAETKKEANLQARQLFEQAEGRILKAEGKRQNEG